MAAIVIWLAVLTLVVIVWGLILSCACFEPDGIVTQRECKQLRKSLELTVNPIIDAIKRHLDIKLEPERDEIGRTGGHVAVPISRCSKCKQEVEADE